MPPSRREDLIDAAMRVFHQGGFHGTCIDKVLHEAGVSRMTLYNHFKSKDDLIAAALRRQDEIFRNGLIKFVESGAADPDDRLLAVFDYHEQWFERKDFCGCMFINACAEFNDPASPVRQLAAEHAREVVGYLRKLCEEAGLPSPATLAEHINLLLEGAIVTAQFIGRGGHDDAKPHDAARRAKEAAERLIEAARSD